MYEETIGKTRIRYIGMFNPALPKEFGDYVHQAAEAAIRWWRAKIAPLHFTGAAFSRYGGLVQHVYKPRVGRNKRKMYKRVQDRPDNQNPLVWSGDLRDSFLSGSLQLRRVGQGNKARVRASWPGLPKHAYYFNPARSQNQHAMHLELTIVNEREYDEMREVFARELEKAYSAPARG